MMPDRQLALFFDAIAANDRVTATHIVLYVVLLVIWERGGFTSPFSVSRSRVMKMSKIRGKTTYHNYMKELVKMGFIRYEPSYHPKLGSRVWVV